VIGQPNEALGSEQMLEWAFLLLQQLQFDVLLEAIEARLEPLLILFVCFCFLVTFFIVFFIIIIFTVVVVMIVIVSITSSTSSSIGMVVIRDTQYEIIIENFSEPLWIEWSLRAVDKARHSILFSLGLHIVPISLKPLFVVGCLVEVEFACVEHLFQVHF